MLQDLKFALMQLRRSPRFHLLAVATLALGIGATTAIFSLVNGVLLRSLPFPHPDRLVALNTLGFPAGLPLGSNPASASPIDNSYPDFFDWRRQSHSFASIASYSGTTRKFTSRKTGKARIIDGVHVSSGFFEVLGVLPEYGRSFTLDDERVGTCSVIISHRFWISEFGGSLNSIGAPITLSDNACTLIGVMPAGFSFPYQNRPPEFWRTFSALPPEVLPRRAYRDTNVVARLRDGLELSQAQADVTSLQRGLASSFPEDRNFGAVAVTPLLENLTGAQRQPLFLLFASVTGVLLIACVNVAGLLLARGVTRKTEFSVRIALGASRRQIIRQVLLESVILSCLGGVAGVALAFLFLRTFLAIVPGDLPRIQSLGIDGATLLFCLGISVITGVGFGLFPAWSSSRSDSTLALGKSRSNLRGRHEGRTHSALVVAEVATSLVLLAGSGLLIRSFVETVRVHPGFDTHGLLTFRLGMSHTKYPPEKVLPFLHQVESALSALPGVQSVTSAYPIPFTYDELSTFRVGGIPYDPTDPPTSKVALVAPLYFETLKIPLLRGRTFTDRDNQHSARVALVNAEFALRYFPNGDAIGKSIQPHLDDDNSQDSHDWYEVVGIVANTRMTDLTQTPEPEFFLSIEQWAGWVQGIIIRVPRNPDSYITAVYSTIAGLDPDVPFFDVSSIDDRVTQSIADARFEAQLLTYFALAALLLSAIGLYATLSEMVARRTSEIGLRVALGARPGDIFQLVLKRGLVMAILGVFIGLFGFWIASRSLSDFLYNISTLDPWTIFVASITLVGVSLLASLWPAWLAVRLQPMDALREQ
jgi:putative ABC transport system permease protein